MFSAVILIFIGATLLFFLTCGAGIFPWTVCLTAIVSCVLLVLLQRRCGGFRGPDGQRSTHADVITLYAVFTLFLLLTLLPLPLPATRVTGALRFEQNLKVTEAVQTAHACGLVSDDLRSWFPTTRNRSGTLQATALLLAALPVFLLVSNLPIPTRRKFLRGLCAVATVVAAAGYVSQWIIPQKSALWWTLPVPPVQTGRLGPIGCFINPNHFGSFTALFCPIALTHFVEDLRNRRWLRALFPLFQFLVLSLALVYSLSRGSLVACIVGLGVTGLLLLRFLARRRILLLLVILGACLLAVTGVTLRLPNHPLVRDRLETFRTLTHHDSFRTRLNESAGCLAIWKAYPLIGAGANAYRIVYPQYRVASSSASTSHAENEYLQLLADCGLVGVGLFGLWMALLIRSARRFLSSPACHPPLAIAVCGAATVAAVHASCDFAPHLPLYAFTLCTILGLILEPPPAERPASIPAPARWRACPESIFLLLAAIFLSFFSRSMYPYGTNLIHREETPLTIARGLTGAPSFSYLWSAMGRAAWAAGTPATLQFAARCMNQAAEYDPKNYHLWLDTGKLRLETRDYRGAEEAFQRVKALRSWVPIPAIPKEGTQ